MPIRTNRGRAAVYRKLWGWPLRSPLHLVTTVLAMALIAAVAVLVSQYAHHDGPGESRPRAAGASTTVPAAPAPRVDGSAATAAGSPATRDPGPEQTPKAAAPAAAALQVAKSWAAAWVHHPAGTTSKQWLAGMRPYTTPEFLPVMASVDPANVPASKVTGDPQVTHSYTSSVEVLIPTDGPELDITVIKTSSGWRVAKYAKAS